jgi:hypothetical protein
MLASARNQSVTLDIGVRPQSIGDMPGLASARNRSHALASVATFLVNTHRVVVRAQSLECDDKIASGPRNKHCSTLQTFDTRATPALEWEIAIRRLGVSLTASHQSSFRN